MFTFLLKNEQIVKTCSFFGTNNFPQYKTQPVFQKNRIFSSLVVTKIELYNLLKEKIGEVQAKTLAELESKIANAKVDIIRWLIATNVALAGLMIAAVKLMM